MNRIRAAIRRWRWGQRPFRYQAVPLSTIEARGWHAYRGSRRYTSR